MCNKCKQVEIIPVPSNPQIAEIKEKEEAMKRLEIELALLKAMVDGGKI